MISKIVYTVSIAVKQIELMILMIVETEIIPQQFKMLDLF